MNAYCVANSFVKSRVLPRKWYPPTWLLPPATNKYDESKETHRTISDALYVIEGLGYVAI